MTTVYGTITAAGATALVLAALSLSQGAQVAASTAENDISRSCAEATWPYIPPECLRAGEGAASSAPRLAVTAYR